MLALIAPSAAYLAVVPQDDGVNTQVVRTTECITPLDDRTANYGPLTPNPGYYQREHTSASTACAAKVTSRQNIALAFLSAGAVTLALSFLIGRRPRSPQLGNV